jgi:4-amino-4-deoxy-L-arabinose transferase-like glycosyltransferase
MTSETRVARLLPVAVVLAGLGVYLFVAASSTLWDRDEPRFARAAVEMLRSGDWLVPRFNGKLRPDKPALIYWLMSVPLWVFGSTSFAARVVSPLAIAVSALLIGRMARRLFDDRVALLATAIFLTCPLTLIEGTAATTDAVLLASLTGAMAILVDATREGFTIARTIALGGAFGAAMLAKGPVGLAVPVLGAMTTYIIARRDLAQLRRRAPGFLLSIGLGTILFLAWAIPANQATGGELARLGLGHHVVQRSVSPLEGHGGAFLVSLPYYIPVLIVGFFPWSFFLPMALVALSRSRGFDTLARATLIGWTLPIFLLMSFVQTKLPHYIFPMWPALSLAAAVALARATRGELLPAERRAIAITMWIVAPCVLAAAIALMTVPWFFPLWFGLRWTGPSFFAVGLLLAVVVVLGLLAWRRRVSLQAVRVFAFGMTFVFVEIAIYLLPTIERFKPAPIVAAAVRREISEEAPVAALGFIEPSLIFHLDRPRPIELFHTVEQAVLWSIEAGPGAIVTTRIFADEIAQRLDPRDALIEIAHASGLNVAKGSNADVVALLRKGRDRPTR